MTKRESDGKELITMQDIRANFRCRRGVQDFCERTGLDYDRARHEGLTIEEVEATGDGLALILVEAMRNGKA